MACIYTVNISGGSRVSQNKLELLNFKKKFYNNVIGYEFQKNKI